MQASGTSARSLWPPITAPSSPRVPVSASTTIRIAGYPARPRRSRRDARLHARAGAPGRDGARRRHLDPVRLNSALNVAREFGSVVLECRASRVRVTHVTESCSRVIPVRRSAVAGAPESRWQHVQREALIPCPVPIPRLSASRAALQMYGIQEIFCGMPGHRNNEFPTDSALSCGKQ